MSHPDVFKPGSKPAKPVICEQTREATLAFLKSQRAAVLESRPPRPWYLWELHNPWGRSASIVDSWGFLDLCHDSSILDGVNDVIGPDIILYDSQFSSGPAEFRSFRPTDWIDDAIRCPADPQNGAVVHIVFEEANAPEAALEIGNPDSANDRSTVPLERGVTIVHHVTTRYRYLQVPPEQKPFEYVIRYFSGASKYLRQQDNVFYRRLNVLTPLQNFATKPLWLVHGEDRAGNDFVTGFRRKAGHWTEASW